MREPTLGRYISSGVATGVLRAASPRRAHIDNAATPRAALSRAALRWTLIALIKDRRSISSLARALGVAWNTANSAILTEGQRVLLEDPNRCDGVEVLGMDESPTAHTKSIAVGGTPIVGGTPNTATNTKPAFIDLTPVRDKTGPAQSLDMVS